MSVWPPCCWMIWAGREVTEPPAAICVTATWRRPPVPAMVKVAVPARSWDCSADTNTCNNRRKRYQHKKFPEPKPQYQFRRSTPCTNCPTLLINYLDPDQCIFQHRNSIMRRLSKAGRRNYFVSQQKFLNLCMLQERETKRKIENVADHQPPFITHPSSLTPHQVITHPSSTTPHQPSLITHPS